MPKIGKKIDTVDIIIDVPVSTVETIGLAMPPVVAVDVSRVEAVVVLTAEAVPPPAIIAKDHVIIGDKSAAVDAITAVPANAAKGIAMVSKIVSNHGM